MAQTAAAPRRILAVGSITEMVAGVVSVLADGTTTVTVPQLSVIEGCVASSSGSDLVAVATSISGNVITFDSETSTQTVSYICWGKGFN